MMVFNLRLWCHLVPLIYFLWLWLSCFSCFYKNPKEWRAKGKLVPSLSFLLGPRNWDNALIVASSYTLMHSCCLDMSFKEMLRQHKIEGDGACLSLEKVNGCLMGRWLDDDPGFIFLFMHVVLGGEITALHCCTLWTIGLNHFFPNMNFIRTQTRNL